MATKRESERADKGGRKKGIILGGKERAADNCVERTRWMMAWASERREGERSDGEEMEGHRHANETTEERRPLFFAARFGYTYWDRLNR